MLSLDLPFALSNSFSTIFALSSSKRIPSIRFGNQRSQQKLIETKPNAPSIPSVESPKSGKVMASPKVKKFARDNNIDLTTIVPTGEKHQVTLDDVKKFLGSSSAPKSAIRASPKVKKIAREKNIDLSSVPATGKYGQISMDDIQAFLSQSAVSAGERKEVLLYESMKQVKASPKMKKLAQTLGIDLRTVRPTGVYGQVIKSDIDAAVARAKAPKPKPVAPKAEAPKPVIKGEKVQTEAGPAIIQEISTVRKSMARVMSEAAKIPHTGCIEDYYMDKFIQFRDSVKETINKKYGVKISYTPFFMKAVSLCMTEYPVFNSSLVMEGDEPGHLLFKENHNIALAMDSPFGLISQNVKACEKKSIAQIGVDLNNLVKNAAAGRMKKEDLVGGTFTISNVGGMGSRAKYPTPLVTPPAVCILALGAFRKEVCVNEKNKLCPSIEIRTVMDGSYGCDHRVIEGAQIVRFSKMFAELMEKPDSWIPKYLM